MKSLKGCYRITPAKLPAALLLGLTFAAVIARADEVAPNTWWSDQKIEAAFHDVLAHGDLSDIGFLGRTLGLEFEVVQWEVPSSLRKETIETRVIATRLPSYLPPYGMDYELTRNTHDGTTGIHLRFGFTLCPELGPWAKDWNQQVEESEELSSDDGPAFSIESIRWQQDAEGIVLRREATNEFCVYWLLQNEHAALSVPKPPATTPGPGTQLLEQVIDLVVAGDLRDYLRAARILRTVMSTDGELRGQLLYDASATPERVIPGTDTRFFMYSVNDTGWINMGAPVFIHRRGHRSARLWMAVDTVANCISPESLEARMRQRHIRFRKGFSRDFGPYLRTYQQGNAFTLDYELQGSCIAMFKLEQETHAGHSTR